MAAPTASSTPTPATVAVGVPASASRRAARRARQGRRPSPPNATSRATPHAEPRGSHLRGPRLAPSRSAASANPIAASRQPTATMWARTRCFRWRRVPQDRAQSQEQRRQPAYLLSDRQVAQHPIGDPNVQRGKDRGQQLLVGEQVPDATNGSSTSAGSGGNGMLPRFVSFPPASRIGWTSWYQESPGDVAEGETWVAIEVWPSRNACACQTK